MYSSKLRSSLASAMRSARSVSSMRGLVATPTVLSSPRCCLVRQLSTQPLAKDSEAEYNFDEVEINSMLKAEEDRLASYNGIQVINSTGVRAVEFCRPDKGNYLTTDVIQNLINKIDDFEDNWVANAIFLGSQSLFFFSGGVHSSDFLQQEENGGGMQLDKSIQVCASRVLDFPNHMISLYGGYITGTPFGMLLGSHYRLGTPSLLLCLDEPTRGQLPIGGLALGFARHSTIAPVVLKYLAVSGATLHSTELYEMGVLTHLTDHKPHRGLQFGDTMLLKESQAVQSAHAEATYLDDMIDDMDINVEMEGDIHTHEVWDKFLTVPVTVPDEDPMENTNIKLIFDEMEPCFTHGVTLEEAVHMLIEKKKENPDNEWVDKALQNIVKTNPLALKCWYRLVDKAEGLAETYKNMKADSKKHSEADCANFYKRSHADILALEVSLNDVLRKHQLDGEWGDTTSANKEEFKLSFYEDDPEEVVDMLERKTLKQLTEEEEEIKAARKQKEDLQNANVQAFLMSLAEVSEAQVDAVFSATVPALEE